MWIVFFLFKSYQHIEKPGSEQYSDLNIFFPDQYYCAFLKIDSTELQCILPGGFSVFLKLSCAIFVLICMSCQFSCKLWILKITKHTKAMLSFLQRRAFISTQQLDFSRFAVAGKLYLCRPTLLVQPGMVLRGSTSAGIHAVLQNASNVSTDPT